MKKTIIVMLFLVFLYSCQKDLPLQVDGTTELQIQTVWTTINSDSIETLLPLGNAELILVSEYGTQMERTNEEGIVSLSDLPSAIYQISAKREHPEDSNILIVGSLIDIEVVSGSPVIDTIFAKPFSSSGISINEIYSGGPVNNFNFCQDQFIELFNSSNEIKYLDGMQVFRLSNTDNGSKPPGGDWNYDDDIDGVSFAFKFPGSPGEQNFPFEPHTFVVLAQDAYNHQNMVSSSIDLRNADWEFVNQLDALDIDNPNVPNLYNLRLDYVRDFLIRTYNDIVIIASGDDAVWEDGIDIETVLDGVEYQAGISFPNTLDERIDRGWILNPPIYTGQSMQRREKGFDTNNGFLDWETIPYPTPGWQ